MKKLFGLILMLISISAFAQKADTAILYTDANLHIVDQEKAEKILKSYRKDSSGYIFETYTAKKILLQREAYADINLTIRNGIYMEYENGKPSLKGLYLNNKKQGNFISFDSLGKVTEISMYKSDTLKTLTTFWPNGQQKMEHVFSQGKGFGSKMMYYENGNLALRETYDKKGETTDSTYLDIAGNATARKNIELMPEYPGGITKFYDFLARNVKYPIDAQDNNIQGEVQLSFSINEQGAIENIKIAKSAYPSLDAEAIRVLKLMSKFKPGQLFGKAIKVKWNVPIKFSLSQ